MNVGTSAPPTGMTPKGRPIAVPRAHAGAASLSSARERKGRPVTFIWWAAGSRRIREATWKTSPRARIATETVTSEMPSNRLAEP